MKLMNKFNAMNVRNCHVGQGQLVRMHPHRCSQAMPRIGEKQTFIFFCILFLMTIHLSSCKGGEEKAQRISTLEMERDSILSANGKLNSFLDIVSQSMDSILLQEGYILNMPDAEGRPASDKERLMKNLDSFGALLERQRSRIEQLEDSLTNLADARNAKFLNILRGLQAQIKEKDEMISELRAELSKKDANIAQLQSRVSALNEKTQEQETIMTVQSDMMNEGYVRIGTRKELQKDGIISRAGLFKKKLNVSNFNAELFTKIDIRTFLELRIEGKNPEVITQMPASSYQIEENEDGTYTLRILDPTLFWSVSNYLVIQYK